MVARLPRQPQNITKRKSIAKIELSDPEVVENEVLRRMLRQATRICTICTLSNKATGSQVAMETVLSKKTQKIMLNSKSATHN